MYIRLLPGATPASVLEPLQRVTTAVGNLSTAHFADSVQRRYSYLAWAHESVAALRHVIAPADLNRLIRTAAFWHIHASASVSDPAQTLTIGTEIDARKTEITQLHNDLQAQVERWSAVRIVVPDTSMFIRHDKLEEWDLAPLLNLAVDEPLHIIVPMAVVDELDRLKEASQDHLRWRGRYSTAVLDRVLPDPLQIGELRPKGYEEGRGRVTVEVLLDPPEHFRLPHEDAEIVDQAHAVNGLAAQPVTVLTYDTNQSMIARARGLQCRKLPVPPEGAEPKNPRK
jgi:hypothetical protein